MFKKRGSVLLRVAQAAFIAFGLSRNLGHAIPPPNCLKCCGAGTMTDNALRNCNNTGDYDCFVAQCSEHFSCPYPPTDKYNDYCYYPIDCPDDCPF